MYKNECKFMYLKWDVPDTIVNQGQKTNNIIEDERY